MFGRVDFRRKKKKEEKLFGRCLVGMGRGERDSGAKCFLAGSLKSFLPKMGRKVGGEKYNE